MEKKLIMFHNKLMISSQKFASKVVLYFALIWALFLSVFVSQSFAQANNEQINLFSSKIIINQDTSISIEEMIKYETTLDKHGIFRYIPVTYNSDGRKKRLDISQVSVEDEAGHTINFEQNYSGPYLNLKIGDPDKTFTGKKTYLIKYQVEKAINRFDSHDELYWDITGEGWQIPIMNSRAEIISTFADIQRVDCFTGQVGTDNSTCNMNLENNTIALFVFEEPINYGDNFTVVIGLNKDNQLIFPSNSEKFLDWLGQNWPLALVFLPIITIFTWWWKKGRDIEFISANVYSLDKDRPTRLKPFSFRSRAPFVYAPLENLTPGEAGALLDEKVDSRDIVAEILEIARKKFLKIELIEKKKLLGKNRDYKFTKLKKSSTKLTDTQAYLHQEIFKDKDEVKVSELKGKFYKTMAQASKKIDQSLLTKKIYTQSPSSSRGVAMVIFFALFALALAVSIYFASQIQIFWPVVILLFQFPFGIWFAYNAVQKTAIGNNLSLQAKGLKKSIQYGKWREEIKEKNLFIEEVFPFAVSLGVVNQLAKQMEDLNIEPPSYLHTTGITTWSTTQLINDFSSEVSSNLSYNPSSSSSSGGSGFSGGSSGGGGGGGGGGSW